MQYARVAAVTGANKGIGFAIVRNLALQYPSSALNTGPLLIYLTARNKARGEAALDAIRADAQLASSKALRKDGGLADVAYHALDVSDDRSIEEFEAFLKERHPEGLDVLVNNAGVALDGFDAQVVRDTLACNYHGTLRLTSALLPHMRAGGRIVNMSSMVGKLNKYSPALTAAFRAATRVPQVTALMDAWQASVDKGTWREDGWPSTAYAVSKTGLTGATMALGREQLGRGGRGVLVNCCCPGYVDTDMTKHRGRKTPDQGARTPVMLALADIGGVGGEFWEHGEVSSW